MCSDFAEGRMLRVRSGWGGYSCRSYLSGLRCLIMLHDDILSCNTNATFPQTPAMIMIRGPSCAHSDQK